MCDGVYVCVVCVGVACDSGVRGRSVCGVFCGRVYRGYETVGTVPRTGIGTPGVEASRGPWTSSPGRGLLGTVRGVPGRRGGRRGPRDWCTKCLLLCREQVTVRRVSSTSTLNRTQSHTQVPYSSTPRSTHFCLVSVDDWEGSK